MEFTKKKFVSVLTLLSSRKKHCKLPYLNCKANRTEHAEEDLFNLSSDNVYLLFVSFCRFHKNFGPQLDCKYA